jgi:hypothetical protein
MIAAGTALEPAVTRAAATPPHRNILLIISDD